MHEQQPSEETRAPRKTGRKIALGAGAAALGIGALFTIPASVNSVANTPGASPAAPLPNCAPRYVGDPLAATAASELARGLRGSLLPRDPNAQMGGSGPNRAIIFKGEVDILAPDGAVDYSITDPIVSSTALPAVDLDSGWVVTQTPEQDGTVDFTPLDLSTLCVGIHPVDASAPYEGGVAVVLGAPGENGLAGTHVFEATPDGFVYPDARLPGYEHNFAPMK